jgi:hypothetical protein
MKSKGLILRFTLAAALGCFAISAMAQTASVSATTATSSTVPRVISYSGVLKNADGKTLTSITGVTFLLYKDEQGGPPLWLETQNVTPDKTGHYSVQLGTTSANGVASDLFVSGEARWLAVQIANDTEQPRVLLVAVPYAMKAADSETIGGLPPSAFVLAAPPTGGSTPTATENTASAPSSFSAPPSGSSNVTTTGGTANRLPLFTTATNIQNSILTQTGTAAVSVAGKLNLPAAGTATAAAGKNSQPLTLAASAFNSGTSKAVSELFQWQAEPAGNNTSAASGTLNLLFGAGTAVPAETGLRINSKGQFTFASGQAFPGTITAVNAGTDLLGGGSSGVVTLNLNTTKVPQLAAANTFTGNQTVNGTLTATSSAGTGVAGTSGSGSGVSGTSTSAIGVLGSSSSNVGTYGSSGSYVGVFGQSTSFYGVYGTSSSNYGMVGVSGSGNGVYAQGANIGLLGESTSSFVNSGWGVEGESSSNVGVYGASAGASSTGASFGTDTGVWGDTGNTSALGYSGVVGTADDQQGGAFYNNGVDYASLSAANFSSDTSAIVFSAGLSNFCITEVSGSLFCTGSKSAIVPVEKGERYVALYAVEAPENWFEDAGSARLVKGQALVNLEPVFDQTVNTDIEYHVFLTPKGDCKGLYIAKESPDSFEVRELGGGTSSVAFDYRIMAKRKGYEGTRLADKTPQFKDQQTRVSRMMVARANTKPRSNRNLSAKPLQPLTRPATQN